MGALLYGGGIIKYSAGLKIFLGSAVLLAAVALLLVLAVNPTAPPRKVFSVTLAIQNNIFSMLPIIAKERGYFEENGLEVKFKKFSSGKLALQAMLEDKADLATSAGIPLMVAAFERDDFQIAATIGFSDTALKVLANRKAIKSSPLELVGKKIGVQELSATHYFLETFLNYHDISANAVNIKFYGIEDLPRAIGKGEVDAICARNPYLLRADEELAGESITFRAPDFYRQYFAIAGKRSFLEREARLRYFLEALISAREFSYKKPEEAKDILKKFFGDERAAEIDEDWDDYRFRVNLGEGFLTTLENQAMWHMAKNSIALNRKPNFLNFMRSEPLRKLSPYAVTIRK